MASEEQQEEQKEQKISWFSECASVRTSNGAKLWLHVAAKEDKCVRNL